MSQTVLEMVKINLRENNCDGLFSEFGCGCLLEDLAPCGEMLQTCAVGKKRILTVEDVESGRYDGCEAAKVGDWVIE